MPAAQLSRLQPQINALSSLFGTPATYVEALSGLLEKYRGELDHSAADITAYSLIKRLNVPDIVLSQLGISYNYLAATYPEQAVSIADVIWEYAYFEYKQLALNLLSKLPDEQIAIFFERITRWVQEDTEVPIISEILNIGKSNSKISSHPSWIALIANWSNSDDFHLAKIGLRALKDFIAVNKSYPLPGIFIVIQPIFAYPNIKIHTELLELVKALIHNSMNETAAFMISLAIQYPHLEMQKFIRKCIPFFPDLAAQKIKESLQN